MLKSVVSFVCTLLAIFCITKMQAQGHGPQEKDEAVFEITEVIANPDQYSDEEIVRSFSSKANSFFSTNADSVFYYFNALAEFGIELKRPLLTAVGYKSGGHFNRMKGKVREAITLNRKALSYLDEDHRFRATTCQALGSQYLYLDKNEPNRGGLLDSADYYLHEGLRIALKIKHRGVYTLFYESLGNLYFRQKRYHSSIDAYITSLKYADEAISPLSIISSHGGLARTYRALKNPEQARIHLQKAMDIAAKEDYPLSKARIKIKLAGLDILEEHYAEAIPRYKSAIAYHESREMNIVMVESYADLAFCYIKLEEFDKAKINLDKALNSMNQSQDYENSLAYFYTLGTYHQATGNYVLAEKNFIKTIEMGTELDLTFYKLLAFEALDDIYATQGKFARALAMKDSVINMDRMLHSDAQKNILYDYATKYESTKKEKAILQLNADKELQAMELNKKERQLMMSLLTIIFAILAIGGVIYALRVRNRSNLELTKSNDALSKSVEEKELLLKEIHHRVKNNLQVISGLLKWQSSHIKDEKALSVFNEGQNRVQSMAIIHQKLYQTDNLMGIDMNDYIHRLSESLVRSYNLSEDQIDLITNIETLNLDIDTVIPLGLILNELISNALKHAFPKSGTGEIAIKLFEDSMKNELLLEVQDNGVGMSSDQLKQHGESFGMELVETLSKKLKAELSIDGAEGTKVQLRIKNYKLAG